MTPASHEPFLSVRELSAASLTAGRSEENWVRCKYNWVYQFTTASATRWGSRLQMNDRVLEQERALSKVLSSYKKTRPLVPTWQDIEVLETIKESSETPSRLHRRALSGEEYVTLSYVRPVVHMFNNSLPTVEYFNSKYADPSTGDLLDIVSLLDPRFKARYISGEKLDALKHKVIAEAESLSGDQPSCLSEPADRREAAVAVPPTAKKKKSLASFSECTPTTTSTTCTQKEAFKLFVGSLCRQ